MLDPGSMEALPSDSAEVLGPAAISIQVAFGAPSLRDPGSHMRSLRRRLRVQGSPSGLLLLALV